MFNLFEAHFIPRQSASFVGEKEWNSAQFFWDGTASHDRLRNCLVPPNLPCIEQFCHIQIDTQWDGNDVGEEEDKTHQIAIPGWKDGKLN